MSTSEQSSCLVRNSQRLQGAIKRTPMSRWLAARLIHEMVQQWPQDYNHLQLNVSPSQDSH